MIDSADSYCLTVRSDQVEWMAALGPKRRLAVGGLFR